MPQVEATVSCPVYDSFRVQQVAGLFDVPIADRATASFAAEVPDLTEPWQIGLIVGPSGSGKTTLARAAFAGGLYDMPAWPRDQAVIDAFGKLPMRSIVGLLTATGFGSPPAWIKPYHVLSGGERFRCDLARALSTALESSTARAGTSKTDTAEPDMPLVVFDEFTSVVDRQVAQVGSAAIARAVRNGLAGVRFVAVSCHYDVAEWLQPDWVLDMATRRARAEAASATGHRIGNLSLPSPNVESVCAASLFEREPGRRRALLPGQVARRARCIYRHVATGRQTWLLANHAHGHVARLSRHRHWHAVGRGGRQTLPRRRFTDRNYGQPSGRASALRTLAAMANRSGAEDRIAAKRSVGSRLSRFAGQGRGVV